MIQELWDYLTTTTSGSARKEGYLYHSIALAHRARRCRQHWSGHLNQCHASISSCLEHKEKGGTVAVLGSGLLLETPIKLLNSYFDQIDLVDVVHTKDVRSSVALNPEHAKVRFIEMDLNKETLQGRYDCVISANLLSQLPYLIIKKLVDKSSHGEGPNKKVEVLTRDLQERHLNQILSLSERRILFSDFEMKVCDPNHQLLEKVDTVSKNLKLNWKKKWNWNLAPIPELSKNYSVELLVGLADI
jgi:hypothetical protein